MSALLRWSTLWQFQLGGDPDEFHPDTGNTPKSNKLGQDKLLNNTTLLQIKKKKILIKNDKVSTNETNADLSRVSIPSRYIFNSFIACHSQVSEQGSTNNGKKKLAIYYFTIT